MKPLFLVSLFVVLAPAAARAQWLPLEFTFQEQEEKKSGQDARKSAQEAAARRTAEELTREANRIAQDATRIANEAISAVKVLQSARSLRLRGRHAEAAKLYADFIANNKSNTMLHEARFWLAKSYLADQKWDEAAEAFTEFLKHHPDRRSYAKQAKEDRIYCWRLRQKENPKAVPGLKAALRDADEEIRILAALALAEARDVSGRRVLEEQGLNNARLQEQSALALWRLGFRRPPRPAEGFAPRMRMLVIKIKTDDPGSSIDVRIPVNFLKGLENILPNEVRVEMADKNIEMPNLAEMAASAAKGQILFQFKTDDGKTSVVISVD